MVNPFYFSAIVFSMSCFSGFAFFYELLPIAKQFYVLYYDMLPTEFDKTRFEKIVSLEFICVVMGLFKQE